MKSVIRIAAVAACSAAFTPPLSADESGPAIRGIPVFDAHTHRKEPAWGPYPVKTAIELMDRSGVALAVESSIPDDAAIKS